MTVTEIAPPDGQPEEPRPKKRLRIWLAVGSSLVVVVTVVLTMATRFGSDPRLVDSPLIGKPAPAIELEYLESPGIWSLEDMRGQVVVVNFWASWCVACRLEHDDLLAAAEAYRNQGVRFLGVDFQDDRAEAIAFLDEMGRGYDYVADPGSRVAVDYGVFGIPETFFIDGNGIVRAKIAGESNFATLSAALDEILEGDSVPIDG
jgi:cytochrome c biogenesis protein CcmG/thiol:disulfide interchange protein DsbE